MSVGYAVCSGALAASGHAARPCFSPLDRDLLSFCQTFRNRSISASVVAGPVLMRIAPRASSAATPIAASTCDGATFPDEQAAPDVERLKEFLDQAYVELRSAAGVAKSDLPEMGVAAPAKPVRRRRAAPASQQAIAADAS